MTLHGTRIKQGAGRALAALGTAWWIAACGGANPFSPNLGVADSGDGDAASQDATIPDSNAPCH